MLLHNSPYISRFQSKVTDAAKSFVLVLSLSVWITACSSNSKQWDPTDYTVKSGDTVYSIAWRYELDPESFAAWNSISTSTFIKPGQRLHTRKPAGFDPSKQKSSDRDVAYAPKGEGSGSSIDPDARWVRVDKGDTLYAISRRYDISISELAQLNQLKKPYTIQPGQTIFLKPLRSSSTTKTAGTKTASPTTTRPKTTTGSSSTTSTTAYNWPKTVRWQKPANGKIVKKFNRNKNDAKGIDIAGKRGDPVLASAGGKVVYSGNGLISYGNLIIIKHNKTFLSAYAYNDSLLVKEGDVVKAGQKIATMGNKEKMSPRLHFEIRKNGKPVDPLRYLPW